MRKEERFEEEHISSESRQEPREPRERAHTIVRPLKNNGGSKMIGGVVTLLLIRGWD